MTWRVRVAAALLAVGLSSLAADAARANSTGPPLAHTGDFGQAACNESGCHVGNTLNAAGGSLVIGGVPAQYESGRTYTITITINRNGQSRWGFECSVRQVAGGAQAGNLVATDRTRTEVDSEAGIQYIHHSFGGAQTGSGPKSWSFSWVAPSQPVGTVRFSGAGNAADGNGTNTGDFIYTAQATTNPSAGLTFLTTLYYPRLVTTDNDFTGIAVANLDGSDATLRFTSYDRNGNTLSGSSITNPKEQSLAKAAQLPVVDTQVFGDGLTTTKPVGWFKIESTVRKIVGFFLMFNANLSTMDGADVSSRTLTSFVFPEIEDQGFTQIHVANPNSSATTVTFDLVKSDGVSRTSTVTRTLNANAAVADFVTDLFPGTTPDASDYIRVSASQGVVPFQFLGKTNQYGEGLNGQDTAAAATTLYSPQYVVGGGAFRTTMSVINVDGNAATVTLRFIRDDGTQIGSTQTRTIPGKGKLSITDQAFFLNAGSSQTQGYVAITSSGPKLTGSVVFGDPGRASFSASLPLVSNLETAVVFSQLASNETFFTGLAILNPDSTRTANATIDVYDFAGNLVATKVEAIGPGKRVSQLLTQYFPNLIGDNYNSGYFRVGVDTPVASFALFGTNTLSVLSAVPPQVVP